MTEKHGQVDRATTGGVNTGSDMRPCDKPAREEI
jgi:hypothetical protein